MKGWSIIFCAAVLGLALGVRADISWFNDPDSLVTYDGGGGLPAATSYHYACFLQLIFAGADQINNPARYGQYETGVSGDDMVVDKGWFGFGTEVGGLDEPAAGLMQVPISFDTTGYASGAVFFVRAWTAPAADYASGFVPESPTNFYGDSALYVFTDGTVNDFNFGREGGRAGWSTADVPVPEPSAGWLSLFGGAILWRRSRQRHFRA